MSEFTFAVWPDGTFCEKEEIEEMSHMSDDYDLVTVPETVEEPYVWIEEYAAKEYRHWLTTKSDCRSRLEEELYHPIF